MHIIAIGTARGRNKSLIESKGIEYTEKTRGEFKNADFIITTARGDDGAPILITNAMMKGGEVKQGCYIVDLALTDGGNVEGAKDDEIVNGPNNIRIINKSSYPKERPYQASKLFASAAKNFLLYLIKTKDINKAIVNDPILNHCYVTHNGAVNPLFL